MPNQHTGPQHELDDVLDAIRGEGKFAPKKKDQIATSGGIVTEVAKRLGVSRTTMYKYIDRWKTVADAIEDERSALVDFAESQLVRKVREGHITAIIFTLKTLGKKRGYIESYKVSGDEDEGPIQFVVRKAAADGEEAD